MLKFELNVPERRTLAQRMEELTGIHPVYTRAPLYAYEIGNYTIDRDGNLLVEEANADADLLQTLLEEGLVTGGTAAGTENPDEDTADIGGEQEENPAEDGGTDEAEVTAEDGGADETESTTEDTGAAEGAAAGEEEETVEAAAEKPADEAGLSVSIEMPMDRHTGASLRNLLHLVYTRSGLLHKATGGAFRVADGLIEAIRDDSCICTVDSFLRTVSDYEAQHGSAMEGIELTADRVRFTGFPLSEDADRMAAFGQLAALMNSQAITQKRIQAKGVDDSNERYAMRTWFLRLGMNGDEYKRSRKLLMENLNGHTAFRTADQAERAKEKAARKRDELRAAKAAAQAKEDLRAAEPDMDGTEKGDGAEA